MEIWKDVIGFEHAYQISSLGRVKRKNRIVFLSDGRRYTVTEKILLQYVGTSGYMQIDFSINGIKTKKLVHRLVAEAFIMNPLKLDVVNHKDENKLNNLVSNLEWCTYQYNANYGTLRDRLNPKIKRRKLIQMDMSGNVLRVFDSTLQMQKETGMSRGNVDSACKGKFSHAYGFRWQYAS